MVTQHLVPVEVQPSPHSLYCGGGRCTDSLMRLRREDYLCVWQDCRTAGLRTPYLSVHAGQYVKGALK